ncbi:MAG: hypothetical protein R6W94_04945 [Spirochaetia bacterium]
MIVTVLGAAAALLSGCAGLQPGPLRDGPRPETPQRTGVPGVDAETIERWGEAKAKRYGGFVGRSVLPGLAGDITHIKRKGYIDSVGPRGLDHVHVRYRLSPPASPSVSPPAGAGAHVRDPVGWDHLHYHGVEDVAGAVASWREALIRVASGEMKHRLAENRRAQFDYEGFFYGGRSYTPPPAIPRAAFKSYARRWWKEGAVPGDRPTDARYRKLTDRLTLVIGAEQPGYTAAASRILAQRSLVAPRHAGVPLPTGRRFLDGYYHPVTIYLGGGRPYGYHVRIRRRGKQLETR